MSRRRQPTAAEQQRFYGNWERYLLRTVTGAMSQSGGQDYEAWRSAVFRVAERFGRLRRWEKNIAIVILSSYALNAALGKELERRADRPPIKTAGTKAEEETT